MIWHNDTLLMFNKDIYKRDLSFDDLKEEIEFENELYWTAKIDKVNYLIESENLKFLPARMGNIHNALSSFDRFIINGKTFYKPHNIQQIMVSGQKTFNPPDLIDKFSNIHHSNNSKILRS